MARSLCFWVFLTAWTVFWAIAEIMISALPRVLFPAKVAWASAAARRWSRGLLFAAGARVRIDHPEHRLPGAAILAANHTSWMDVFAMLGHLGPNGRFGAKKSLFAIPLFGWAMRGIGHIALARGDRDRDRAEMEALVARVQRDGISIFWFPEGTRSPDGALQPFKKGIAHFAVQTRLPVQPVVIRGAHEVLPKGRFRVRPGVITLTLGEPLPTSDLAVGDKDRFIACLQAEFEAALGAPARDPASPPPGR